MGDRTPPSNPSLRLGRLRRRRRRRRVRIPANGLDAPPVIRVPRVRRNIIRRNIMRALNNAARGNNNSDNTHQNHVPNHQRPDYIPDPNQARGGGEDPNKDKSEPVQPEIKF